MHLAIVPEQLNQATWQVAQCHYQNSGCFSIFIEEFLHDAYSNHKKRANYAVSMTTRESAQNSGDAGGGVGGSFSMESSAS